MSVRGSGETVIVTHCNFSVAGATVNRWLMSHKRPKDIQQHAQGDWEEGNHTSGLDQSWLLRKKEGVTVDWGPTH